MSYKVSVLLIVTILSILPLFAQNSIIADIDSLIAPLVQKGADIGIDIRDISHDSTFYAVNAQSYMTPASVQKLFVTAASLLKHGEDYQFRTPVTYSGKLKKHKIKGDLVIVGAGDPSMSDRYYQGDALSIFRGWADSLSARGIRKISGNIVILDTLYHANEYGPGWNWDDLAYDYAAKRTSFMFRENRALLLIMGTVDGKPPVVLMDPVADGSVVDKIQFITGTNAREEGRGNIKPGKKSRENAEKPIPKTNSTVVYNDALTMDSASRNSIQITSVGNGYHITGIMKPEGQYEEYVALMNPQMTSAGILKAMLTDKGIKCSGKIRVARSVYDLKQSHLNPLFEHTSPPLSKIIRLTNKQSVNIGADALLFSLDGSGKTSISALKGTLRAMGIQPDSIFIVDGSGLSRYNLCTADQLSDLMENMCDKPEFMAFLASLPIAGRDGSLVRRMKNTPAEGKVFAKTGSMRYVRNLCGYALGANNTLYAFSMLMNDYPNEKEMVEIQDRICELLVGSGD